MNKCEYLFSTVDDDNVDVADDDVNDVDDENDGDVDDDDEAQRYHTWGIAPVSVLIKTHFLVGVTLE